MKQTLLLLATFFTITFYSQTQKGKKTSDFLPKGYVLFEELKGDLNRDNLEDIILIIKNTDKTKIITDKYRGVLDRNRRGIIILFNKKDHYELALKNYDCFSSENEDGGVYYAPELSFEVQKGNLICHYSHGRYGYWKYTFKFQNSDFNLIGYDLSEGGPVIDSETSINFLTKMKQEKVNVNKNAEGGDEIFKEKWTKIKLNMPIKLSEIKAFDELNMYSY